LEMTLPQILKSAIQKEIASRELYVGLEQRVKNPASRETLHYMADQEKTHQQVLELYSTNILNEGALHTDLIVDYKIAEHLDQPEITPEMGLKEIFALAAVKEKASHELYLGLAKIYPDGKIKRLLEDLAGQELEHKLRVETLYTEVAFPQTDGG